MKTNLIARTGAALVASLLLLAVSINSGCVVVAAGAGAGAVAYVRGQLEATLDANFERSVTATNTAIQQLQYAKVSEHKDALIDTIIARNADDKKVEIRLETVSGGTTKVRIRVGVLGNQPTSIAILEKIKANL